MKKHLKSIIELWTDFELSPDREWNTSSHDSSQIIACKDGSVEHCIAHCDPEFAGKTIAFLINTFSDTPSNKAELLHAVQSGLDKTSNKK